MYPLDFEEFLWANGVGRLVIEDLRRCFEERVSPNESINRKMLDLFRKYLLVGGLPDAVNTYVKEHNIVKVRDVHREILELYGLDASKYEKESSRKLKILRIYEMIPSNLENKKKRVKVKDIEGKKGKRTSDYQDEFDYLVSSGVALEVDAISQPAYPLRQNAGRIFSNCILMTVACLQEYYMATTSGRFLKTSVLSILVRFTRRLSPRN